MISKRNSLLTVLLITTISVASLFMITSASTSTSHDFPILSLSDAELSTQFAKESGPATLTAVTDIPGPGVRFNFTGLNNSLGTIVGDNFPVSDLAGGAPKTVDGWTHRADFSHFSEYSLVFTNVGTEQVMVSVKINTGWTIPPPSGRDLTWDTYWQSPWSDWFGPGESRLVTLNFSSCGWSDHTADDPNPAWQHPNGTSGIPVRRLDEVSQIGFQVLGGGGGSIIVSAYPTLSLSDAEFSTQFAKESGPATLTAVTDIPGPGVRFNFTGLNDSLGTIVGDNFPVSKLAGGGYKTYGTTQPFSTFGDFSHFSEYSLVFTNVGTEQVMVSVKINTGWTIPPPENAAGWRNTYWQSPWSDWFGPGESRLVTLNFSSAGEVWDVEDDQEHTGYSNGQSGVAVWRLDEASQIGFQVLGQSDGSIVVSPPPLPAPPQPPVGGGAESAVNTLAILAPWLILASAVLATIGLSAVYVKHRK